MTEYFIFCAAIGLFSFISGMKFTDGKQKKNTVQRAHESERTFFYTPENTEKHAHTVQEKKVVSAFQETGFEYHERQKILEMAKAGNSLSKICAGLGLAKNSQRVTRIKRVIEMGEV